MQILLIGDEDSPPRSTILGALILIGLKVDITTFAGLFSKDIDDIDCAIYVDHKPSSIVVDRLRKNSRSLILVADDNISENSDLFISIDKFRCPKTIHQALRLITRKIASLDALQDQRNIFHLILNPQTAKSLAALRDITSAARQDGNEGLMISKPSKNRRLLKRQESQKSESRALQDWLKGKKREDILKQANISPRTLDRIIAKAKIQYGASDCRQLINRLQV